MRFLCDRMLTRLGKWLRAAGYDTAIAHPGEDDTALLARAPREDRILLTCDSRMLRERRLRDGDGVILLSSSDPTVAAPELAQRIGVDWLFDPFSRCLVDNAPLRAATEAEIASTPEETRALPGPIRACPECGRVYWPGSHAKRMRRKLEEWTRGATPPPGP